ncbi:histidinol-phosphatase [Breoghania sp.]|uniref:histidinol-phosphatase n=1 Tax=Breoghania sp. TaxID=2065378 RepID=UPI0026035EA3|nr:histidinol-phosphatase [Breoghania sp.]MDJ0932457.1 histidinol-phosphatase [Breoghania sp.]
MNNYHDYISFLHRLADAAGTPALEGFRASIHVDNKGRADAPADDARRYDPVTDADRGAERVMRDLIEATYPDHGIIGEEYGALNREAEHVWVLDPIDGTRSFIAGVPLWGTLIGLMREGRPTLGMMAQPYIGERFFGDGQKAHYRGPHGEGAIKTRACPDLSDAILFTTTPGLFNAEERPLYDAVEHKVRLARYGTDCYGYCMLAAGQVDLVIEAGLETYDVAALVPIVEGAGGVMTTWTGAPATDGGRIVASGDPALHEQVLRDLALCRS